MKTLDLDTLDFAKGGGLVSVVVQDAMSGAVLMTAFADREALERTIEVGEMHFHSRSRGRGTCARGACRTRVSHRNDIVLPRNRAACRCDRRARRNHRGTPNGTSH